MGVFAEPEVIIMSRTLLARLFILVCTEWEIFSGKSIGLDARIKLKNKSSIQSVVVAECRMKRLEARNSWLGAG